MKDAQTGGESHSLQIDREALARALPLCVPARNCRFW